MVYLFWAFLNIALLIYFIRTCIKASKTIKESMGMLSLLVILFGLWSFMERPDAISLANKATAKTWMQQQSDSMPLSTISVTLEKTLLAGHLLYIDYHKNTQGQLYSAVKAYCTTNGFIVGTNWEPVVVKIDNTDQGDVFRYEVRSKLDWQLLGAVVYKQEKVYRGLAKIE